MSFLKRLFGGKSDDGQAPRSKSTAFTAPIAPDAPFFAVGDVHGCMAQMTTLMDKINATDTDAPIVFVGDYVDRGEDSAAVLRALFAMRDDPRVTCLAGNHEDMMLNFINDPETHGPRWLRYGGLQTMASFGVGGINPTSTGDALVKAGASLQDAMGADMIAWMEDLPLTWKSGNITVVHAGADPRAPIMLQAANTLKWGHKDFDTVNRDDGIWVLHGHTIVEKAQARDGRIAVDTGAYATGILTAAHVTDGTVTFVQT